MHDPQYRRRVYGRLGALRSLGRRGPAPGRACGEKAGDRMTGLAGGAPDEPEADAPDSPGTHNPSQEGEHHVIKLNAGISRKIGQPNYGSRGASVNIEMELDSGAVGDPQGLQQRIRKLFALAKASVDEELDPGTNGGTPTPPAPAANGHNGYPPTGADAAGAHNGPAATRPATPAQIATIHGICRRQRIDSQEQAHQRFRCPIEQLTLADASSLIDELRRLPPA